MAVFDRFQTACPNHDKGAKVQSARVRALIAMKRWTDADAAVDELFSKYQSYEDFPERAGAVGDGDNLAIKSKQTI